MNQTCTFPIEPPHPAEKPIKTCILRIACVHILNLENISRKSVVHWYTLEPQHVISSPWPHFPTLPKKKDTNRAVYISSFTPHNPNIASNAASTRTLTSPPSSKPHTQHNPPYSIPPFPSSHTHNHTHSHLLSPFSPPSSRDPKPRNQPSTAQNAKQGGAKQE